MARGKGQSKGCRTCRRRKLKCDERHPFCLRCEKSSAVCEGYVREHRFINEVSRTVRHARKSKSKSLAVATTAQRDVPLSPRKSRPGPSQHQTSLVISPRKPSPVPIQKSNISFLPPELSLIAFEKTIYISFLISNLFHGIGTCISWTKTLAEDMKSLTAKNCTLALSTAYFGRLHQQQGVVNRAFELYGTALRNLMDDLKDAAKATGVTVLMGAMTLGIFEFIAFPSKSGWLHHAGGVGRLIELRGPSRHQSLFERGLLEGSRVTIALDCLIKKKRCFLERAEWKRIPWVGSTELRAAAGELHNMLCDMPGLLEDVERLQSPELDFTCRELLYRDLCENLLNHLNSLHRWRWEWESNNPNACYEVISDSTPFQTVLYFSSLAPANEITFYNAMLLLLLKLGLQILELDFNASPSNPLHTRDRSKNPLYLPTQAPNPAAIATEICRSVEYHLLNHHSSAGAFCLLFPLRMAYQTFQSTSRESKWLESVMVRVADLSVLRLVGV